MSRHSFATAFVRFMPGRRRTIFRAMAFRRPSAFIAANTVFAGATSGLPFWKPMPTSRPSSVGLDHPDFALAGVVGVIHQRRRVVDDGIGASGLERQQRIVDVRQLRRPSRP